MPNQFGRRAPKRAPAIQFKDIRTVTIPSHPPAVNYLSPFSNWQMLGNDQYGDCVAVNWANDRRKVSGTLGTEYYPTLAQVLQIYKTQNPGFPNQDDGMDIQTLLEYLNQTGGADGVKCIAFASVDYTNLEELKAAIALFGGVWIGANVQQANVDQFDAQQPWDYVPGSPLAGGHAIDSGGYETSAAHDVKIVTWAQVVAFTDAFVSNLVEEAWVVIWPEHLGSKQFLAGIDLNALAAAYLDITGRPLPITPAPPPPPPPPPPPGPGCLPKSLRRFFL